MLQNAPLGAFCNTIDLHYGIIGLETYFFLLLERDCFRQVGVCNCSMFCCTLLYVCSGIAIILMGKRELVASLGLSSWCLVMVDRLFLVVPWGCLRFVIVVFPDHAHYFLLYCRNYNNIPDQQ